MHFVWFDFYKIQSEFPEKYDSLFVIKWMFTDSLYALGHQNIKIKNIYLCILKCVKLFKNPICNDTRVTLFSQGNIFSMKNCLILVN